MTFAPAGTDKTYTLQKAKFEEDEKPKEDPFDALGKIDVAGPFEVSGQLVEETTKDGKTLLKLGVTGFKRPEDKKP